MMRATSGAAQRQTQGFRSPAQCLDQIFAGFDRRIRTHRERDVFREQYRNRGKVGIGQRDVAVDMVRQQRGRSNAKIVRITGPLIEIAVGHRVPAAGAIRYRARYRQEPQVSPDASDRTPRRVERTAGGRRHDNLDVALGTPALRASGACETKAGNDGNSAKNHRTLLEQYRSPNLILLNPE